MAKILLVEDDQFLLKMYKKKFEVSGFVVEIAHDGLEGLEKMKSFAPDLVMMDIMMPKLSGIEAIIKAKADPSLKDIPIVVLSNLSSTTDAEEAVKKGAVDFLVKSNLTPNQVVNKAKLVLKIK